VEIILNDEVYQNQGSSDQTVQQLADEVCGPLTGVDANIVISLACDGQPVEADRLQEVLDSPLEKFDRIEMRTVRVREQVAAALLQSIDVLHDSSQMRESVADCLNQGRHEQAMDEMRKLLEAIRQVQQTTLISCQLLGIEPATVRADDVEFNSILNDVRNSLTELKDSMENQDFVLVSDLLRYELAGPLEGWLAILNQLHSQADPAT